MSFKDDLRAARQEHLTQHAEQLQRDTEMSQYILNKIIGTDVDQQMLTALKNMTLRRYAQLGSVSQFMVTMRWSLQPSIESFNEKLIKDSLYDAFERALERFKQEIAPYNGQIERMRNDNDTTHYELFSFTVDRNIGDYGEYHARSNLIANIRLAFSPPIT